MKLVEINWKPTDRQLRQFSAICLVALPLVGWLWHGGPTVVLALAAVGVALAIIGWFQPRLITPVFFVLTVAATPFGMVIGELAMFMIYIGVFLPIGLLFRITGRDALRMKADRNAKTYWQPKPQPKNMASYYRQS